MNETKRPIGRPRNLKIARLMKRHKCSRATAYRLAAQKPKMREQSKRTMVERGIDPYFTTPETTISLLHLERRYLPRSVWDPFAGDGAITDLMARFGYETHASDIEDYGLEGCRIVDYRIAQVPAGVEAIISNPPFAWALEFLERALSRCRMSRFYYAHTS